VGLASKSQDSIKLATDRDQANPEKQLVFRITGLEPDTVLSLDIYIYILQARSFAFRGSDLGSQEGTQ
ncbi:hypothetical protein PSHT_00419, partial [Puccinia striiformis]